MSAITKAIYNYFKLDTNDPFYIGIGGRLRHKKAKQEDTFPYCVFFVITDDNDPDFTDDHADIDVQFNIFSKNNSSTEADQLKDYLHDMFDYSNFNVVGWSMLNCQRKTPDIPNDDFEQVPPIQGYTITYTILLEKKRNDF